MLTKNLPVKVIIQFSIVPISIAILWSSAIVSAFYFLDFKWLAIPFLPISLIGIAVSFYLGFKNNASNERQNEARKNWGSITNDSRAFIALLNTYLPDDTDEVKVLKSQILKRHIAWLYAHKSFLRHKRMDWEHNLSINNTYRKRFQKKFNINLALEKDIKQYISFDEIKEIELSPNIASTLLQNQSTALKQLRTKNLIEDFRLFELQNHITKLFEHQGKNERIKTFPIPRQFASYSRLFVNIFMLLLPLGLLKETQGINLWLTIPFSSLISWVFFQMELIGEYSEYPFEGLMGDIPITSITRNIEIEILYALGETDIPKPIAAVDGILM
ncbi:MAG: bestrophin family protein [Cytophagales bacterium]